MSTPAYGPPTRAIPATQGRPLLDAAAAVLLGLAVALLVAGAVLGLRGLQVLSGTAETTSLCQNDQVTVGECLLAVQVRHGAADDLLTQSGATLAAGAVTLVAGTWRGNLAARRLRAGA